MGSRSAIRLAAVASVVLVAALLALWQVKSSASRASGVTRTQDETPRSATDARREAAETPEPRLVIRVLDSETGTPLPGCGILVSTWGVATAAATTGDAGEVEINRLQGEVRAEHRGHVPAAVRVSPAMSLLVIELHLAVPVRGRVVRAGSGEPVVGASVAVTDIDESETLANLLTDRDGRFEIPGVPPARPFLVVARRQGMAPAGTVERRAQPDREIVLELAGGAVLEGRVLRQDDTPAPGAQIVVAPRGAEPLLWAEPDLGDYVVDARADEHGRFRIEGLRTPAAYSATATDGQLATGRVDAIELKADGEAAWRDIKLVSRTTLVVDVEFPPGEPPANPSVNLLGHGAKAYNHAAFDLPEGGTYEVVVYAANWPETRLQVEVAGGVKSKIQVQMSREGHRVLSGRVVTETGVPLGGPGTSLGVSFTTSEGARQTSPTADGTFHLCDIPGSTGRLEVRDDYGMFAPWIREGIAAGGPVKVVLHAAARLVGRVEPVPRSRLVVLHRECWSQIFDGPGSMVGPLVIEEDGRFAIPCEPGRRFRFALEPPDNAPLFLDEPPLAEDETRDLGVLRFGPGFTAEARVLDEIGKGIADASILVDTDNLYGNRRVRGDANGRFRLDRLGETALHLQVSAPGFVARELHFPAPPDLHLQEITLQPAGFVEGTLVGADGRPVAGRTVDCTAPECDDAFYGDTDSLGRFRIAAAPGKYQLLSGEDQGPPVEVRAREVTRVDFRVKE